MPPLLASRMTVRRATRRDLHALEWNGLFTAHRSLIEEAYERQRRGTVTMLVAVQCDGDPVGQAWIDFVRRRSTGAALIWAVRVLPSMHGLGIGATLMDAAEALIRERRVGAAEVGVEKRNTRARRFYERRGYRHIGERLDESTFESPDGRRHRLLFDQWTLRKVVVARDRDLAPASP
jgi:GNAT superfamily N-acetyltransferase